MSPTDCSSHSGEEGMTKTANDISDDNCSIVDLSNAALDITLQTRHVGSNFMQRAWNMIEGETPISVGKYFSYRIITHSKARMKGALTTSPDRDSPKLNWG